MPKREATAEKKSTAIDALMRSAAENEGEPNWYGVSKETGHDRLTLKRWWTAHNANPRPAGEVRTFPGVEMPEEFDPTTASEVGYWLFCWAQLTSELRQSTSDTARVNLFKRQDDVFAKVREAVEAERKRRPATKEEMISRLTSDARMLAPEMAQAMLIEFKRRGIA